MQLLAAALAVILNGFSMWHWYLAVRGLTTIEWMDKEPPFSRSCLDNLELVFGTRNPLRMLLPSLR